MLCTACVRFLIVITSNMACLQAPSTYKKRVRWADEADEEDVVGFSIGGASRQQVRSMCYSPVLRTKAITHRVYSVHRVSAAATFNPWN